MCPSPPPPSGHGGWWDVKAAGLGGLPSACPTCDPVVHAARGGHKVLQDALASGRLSRVASAQGHNGLVLPLHQHAPVGPVRHRKDVRRHPVPPALEGLGNYGVCLCVFYAQAHGPPPEDLEGKPALRPTARFLYLCGAAGQGGSRPEGHQVRASERVRQLRLAPLAENVEDACLIQADQRSQVLGAVQAGRIGLLRGGEEVEHLTTEGSHLQLPGSLRLSSSQRNERDPNRMLPESQGRQRIVPK